MNYYEPYLAHWRPKGSKNGFHLFGEQRPAKYYKLGEKTIGFVNNLSNGMYAAKTGIDNYKSSLKLQREANKLFQEAEKHKAQSLAYWPDGIENSPYIWELKKSVNYNKANNEWNKYLSLKEKAEELTKQSNSRKTKSEEYFNTAKSFSPRLSKMYIGAAKAIYGAVNKLSTFITNTGYKLKMSSINRHNESEKFKASINPDYKPKYKKYY